MELLILLAIFVVLYFVNRDFKRRNRMINQIFKDVKSGKLANMSEDDLRKIKFTKKGDIIYPDDEKSHEIRVKMEISIEKDET